MAVGTVEAVVICTNAPGAAMLPGPVSCGADATGNPLYLATMQGYVVDPASAGYLDGLAQPFDYGAAAGFFALAFTVVVGVWMVSAGAGAVLDLIRRG